MADSNPPDQDLNHPSSTSSPSTLPPPVHTNLTHVANNVNDLLENLEPALARMSHTHPLIAPAPPAPVDPNQSGHHGPTSMTSVVTLAASGLAADGIDMQATPESAKSKRLNRACDACSRRKVKCDHDRPCKNCKDLGIECTFDRPTKRRGPINKVAEEIKRLKRAHPHPAEMPEFTQSGADQGDASPYFFTAESIAPIDAVRRLVRLYFIYVYPLYPFPHEAVFMSLLDNRVDLQDQKFTSLLASLVGVAAMSFPRLARLQLLGFGVEDVSALMTLCVKITTEIRGSQFMSNLDFNVNDAITSFFLGLVGGRTDRWPQFRLYMGEAVGILQMLNLQKNTETRPENYIDVELASRLQAAIYVETQSTLRLGPDFKNFLVNSSTPTAESMPAEVDDTSIFPDRMAINPLATAVPIPIGSNILTRLYIASSIERPEDLSTSNFHGLVAEAMTTCKRIMLEAPPDLTSPLGQGFELNVDLLDAEKRRVQLGVQKAAIQVAALACRTHLAVLLKDCSDVQQAQHELDSVAMELAFFLKKLQPVQVESQWTSFINKVKVIVGPIEEFKETNRDAAYVVQRVLELEI